MGTGREIFDFENLTDAELRDLVRQRLEEYSNLDSSAIEVDVRKGRVRVHGRVGTEQEVDVATEVIDDVLGISDYVNELVVDELHRSQAPEAADESVAMDEASDDQLGEPLRNQSDTAAHLADDEEARLYGTHDPSKAVEGGMSYSPPDRPVGDADS